MDDNRELAQVTQDNALISASYAMSLNEKRLLVLALSKIDPMGKAWLDGGKAKVTAKEWSDVFGIDSKVAYERLRLASKDLYNRSVRMWGDNHNGEEIRWLSAQQYSKRNGYVEMSFGREMVYYLSGMVDQFTSYQLLKVSGLKSTHSIRMYELAKQFAGTGWRHIELEDLRDMFKLGPSYKRWIDLKKFVIDRACEEVTAKSDLKLSYQIVKKGRAVHAIKLIVKKNP
ncbi:MAG: replication initiation protein [Anaerolineales bacterium]|jgi:plasmid replication initiation protein|nr:replication initiation protein [Anaerolineales bacterium]